MDPATVIRSRAYLSALVLATLLGVPISAIAYGFLALVTKAQQYLFDDLPADLFEGGTPAWWPVPFLLLCGLLTGLTIRHLPGNGGHSPAFGFVAGGGPPIDRDLPAIVLAAFATLLPLTSTLLATLHLGADGVSTTPEIVVAVAVTFVVTIILPNAGSGPPHAVPAPGPVAAGSSPAQTRRGQ